MVYASLKAAVLPLLVVVVEFDAPEAAVAQYVVAAVDEATAAELGLHRAYVIQQLVGPIDLDGAGSSGPDSLDIQTATVDDADEIQADRAPACTAASSSRPRRC